MEDRKIGFASLGTPFNPINLNRQIEDAKTSLKLRPSKAGMPETKTGKAKLELKAENKSKSKKKTRTKTENQDSGNIYVNPTLEFHIDSSEDFTTDVPQDNRIGLFPERRTNKIEFNYIDSMPLSVMQLEDNYTPPNTFPAGDTVKATPKLTFNLASYARNFKLSDSNSVNSIWSQHLSIIFARYSRDIVANIRSKIIDDWTDVNFKSYLYDVTELLEYFYCVDSILSYEASYDKKDRNPILVAMKGQYSDFDILVKHDEAKRILKNCWFPDKFSSLIAWTYQNYKTGPGDQCANYRLFSSNKLFEFGSDGFKASAVVNKYNLLIAAVTTVTNRNIISLLSQTYPKGVIGNLPLSCSISVYDYNHYEMYVNQGIIFPGNETATSIQGYPDEDDYNLYSSMLSAEEAGCFPFVLQASFNDVLGDFSNGMLIPIQLKSNQEGALLPPSLWYWMTNKFIACTETEGSDNFIVRPRNIVDKTLLTNTGDTHVIKVDDTAANAVAGVAGCNSMSKGQFQNLYFNTNDSRKLVMREFLNVLFYLK